MFPNWEKGPIKSRNQTALNQSKKLKIFEDLFGLLFDLVGELIDIRGELDVASHPILTILYENIQDLEEKTFGKCHLRHYIICFYIWKRI